MTGLWKDTMMAVVPLNLNGSSNQMDFKDEMAEMFRQEHDKLNRSHQETVRKHIEFMLLLHRMNRCLHKSGKAKTPRVRQHPRGKQK